MSNNLTKLEKSLSKSGFTPDAVSVDMNMLGKLISEYEHKFEENFASVADVENFLSVKILLRHGSNSTKDFEFFVTFKE